MCFCKSTAEPVKKEKRQHYNIKKNPYKSKLYAFAFPKFFQSGAPISIFLKNSFSFLGFIFINFFKDIDNTVDSEHSGIQHYMITFLHTPFFAAVHIVI